MTPRSPRSAARLVPNLPRQRRAPLPPPSTRPVGTNAAQVGCGAKISLPTRAALLTFSAPLTSMKADTNFLVPRRLPLPGRRLPRTASPTSPRDFGGWRRSSRQYGRYNAGRHKCVCCILLCGSCSTCWCLGSSLIAGEVAATVHHAALAAFANAALSSGSRRGRRARGPRRLPSGSLCRERDRTSWCWQSVSASLCRRHRPRCRRSSLFFLQARRSHVEQRDRHLFLLVTLRVDQHCTAPLP